ncbi:MAG TPA: DUF6345 domain-containing protein, partial [Candidatus Didemnitutus sp.]|nr:DUF6345 domain-containing protein [Candidatus Didemnitutus sp.]
NLKPRPEVLRSLQKTAKLSLQETGRDDLLLYQAKSVEPGDPAVTVMTLDKKKGHMLWLPDSEALAQDTVKLLAENDAFKRAQGLVRQYELVPDDGSEVAPKKIVTRSRTEMAPDKRATTVDVLQTVLFERTLDKHPMMGKGSQLTVDLANGGEIVGFTLTWNPVVRSSVKAEFLKETEIYAAIEAQIKQRVRGVKLATVKKAYLVYYSDDGKFVTPAYAYTAVLTSPGVKQRAFFAGVVAAVRNPPEPLVRQRKESEPPAPIHERPAKETPPADDDPTVGRYVVRDDSWDWVDDANDFKNGLNAGHPSSYPAITFGDYYWDYPFCWTTNANSFVNKWNIALMEGHGANWLFSTEKNCCDLVDLNASTQPAYGNHAGSSMRFLILKGCSIIPAPPDRSDWDAPWWRIFRGLRQAVGFRTEMYIDDNISDDFGGYIARNCQVIPSFFSATDNCSSYQWERFWGISGDEIYGYGSVITIPGCDTNGIYRITAAAAANSAGLTIWWQH